MKKTPQSDKDILKLTETESRLSLGMSYHFQTTANHHRFIKVWTSIADLPSSVLAFEEKTCQKQSAGLTNLDTASMERIASENMKMRFVKMCSAKFNIVG